MQYTPVEKLSGGERRRLYLATILIHNPNFLILDEPTNDLDIVTLNILEDYLKSFKGCLLVVSHDRYFMDKLVDHLFVFEGDGNIRDYTGNYTEYRQWKLAREAEETYRKAASKPVVPKSPSKENRNKLSYREKKELEELESSLTSLENEKKGIEQMLSNGISAHDELMKASARIAAILAEIDANTDRWLKKNKKEFIQ
jgi:ATP-binding cassette subfamily F protein uup